jgi:SNF2 family DNA or RNA helicase
MRFKTEPYEYQKKVITQSCNKDIYALFMEQGLGKTKVSIDTATAMYDGGAIEAMLVLAPNGVAANWIINELPVHCPIDGYLGFTWRSKKTKKYKTELQEFFEAKAPFKVLAMNIEAIRTNDGNVVAQCFLKQYKCLMIVDESTIIKNVKAQQTKKAIELGKLAVAKRILSGTPIAQSPLDLWGQCQFLSNKALPHGSYTAFKNDFAHTMLENHGGRIYEKVLGYKNLDKLSDAISGFSVRLLKKDNLDLPPKVYQQELVPLSKEQEKAYVDLKEMAITMIDDGLVTTTAAVVLLMKLHQITCGFLTDDDGEIHDLKNERINRLKEICERVDDKIIIWAKFKHSIKQLKKEFGDAAVTYYGETKDRDESVRRFQNDDNCRYFIANEAASRGLTLTASATSIYFTNDFKLETRLQSEDRNHRIGQKRSVSYIDMIAPGTVDEKIHRALKLKQNVSESVLKNVTAIKGMM